MISGMPPSKPSPWANLALAAASFAATALALEGGARWLEWRWPRPKVAAYLWDWERMWQGDFYTLGGGSTGWLPRSEVNTDGLRDRPHPLEKPPRTFRLVFLGDSVTMGHGVSATEAYPRVLQAQLDDEGWRVEVFNVALQGWSTRQELLAYERLARRYQPDLVVLAVCLNDVPELQNNLSRPAGWLAWLHRRSALVRRVVDAGGREIAAVEELFVEPPPRRVREGWRLFREQLHALRQDVEQSGARLAVMVFPFRFQVVPGAPAPVAQQQLAAVCRLEGLDLLDLLPALQPQGTAAFLDYDHLTPGGAETVAAAFSAHGWIPQSFDRRRLLSPGQDPASLLDDPDPARREAAAFFLRGQADRHLDGLVRRLADDPDAGVRAAAARALGGLRPRLAAPALPALWGALSDPSQGVRWEAARTLASLRPSLEPALPRLVALLASEDEFVRGYAASELGRHGPDAAAALPALLAALPVEPRPELVARTVARLDPGGAAVVPQLTAMAVSGTEQQRAAAAVALGCLRGAARPAVPVLAELLRSGPPAARAEAARALGRTGSAEAPVLEALQAALAGDEEPRVRALAARALGWIGPAAAAAAPALRRAELDPSERVAGEAETALRRLAGKGGAADSEE